MPERLLQFDRRLRSILSGVLVVMFAVLTGAVLMQVFSRHVLPISLTWLEDLAKGLLVWLSLLGGAVAYAERAHLGIDLLVHPMEPKVRNMLHRVGHVLICIFAVVVMAGGGGALAWQSILYEQMIPGTPVNRAAVYAAVPVSGIVIAWFALVATWLGDPPAHDAPTPEEAAHP